MNFKILILASAVLILAMACVSASDNVTDDANTTDIPEVEKTPVNVKAPEIVAKYQGKKSFKVKVKDDGKPVKNLKLKISLKKGKKSKTYTIKTNKKGIAKLPTKNLKKGIHKVTVTSKKYSINKTSKITVRPVIFKFGKYTGKYTLKQVNSLFKNKDQINVKTGKYIKFKYESKKYKYPVIMSLRWTNELGYPMGKNTAELSVWSSAGPIDSKAIKLY